MTLNLPPADLVGSQDTRCFDYQQKTELGGPWITHGAIISRTDPEPKVILEGHIPILRLASLRDRLLHVAIRGSFWRWPPIMV